MERLEADVLNVPEPPKTRVEQFVHDFMLTDPKIDRQRLVQLKDDRVTGTCEWIKDHDRYQSWLRGDQQLLWLTAGAGKGKTMLSIYLSEELEKSEQHFSTNNVLYYFCDHQDEKRNNAVAVMRGLLWQLTLIDDPKECLSKHLNAYIEMQDKRQTSLFELESLWRLFAIIMQDQDVGTTYCVLDAFNECDEESTRWLARKFFDFLASSAPDNINNALRLVLVSRVIPSLTMLTKCTPMEIDGGNDEQISADVARMVSYNVEKLSRLPGFTEDFREEVQSTLLERAEGTFLWAGHVMNELAREGTCSGVTQRLHSLPKGLPAIYDRILLDIEQDRQEKASAILRWATMAVAPLTLQELADAVQIKSAGTMDRLEIIRDEVRWFGSFLKIHDKADSLALQTVSLVHQSAREYLLRTEPEENGTLRSFRITPEKVHLDIAIACLERIKNSHLQRKALEPRDHAHWQDSPLLRYAVLNWTTHARYSGGIGKELFSSPSFVLRRQESLGQNWWKTYVDSRPGEEWEQSKTLSPLHVACRFGIVE